MSRGMKRLIWLFTPEDSTPSSNPIEWCRNDHRCWGILKFVFWFLGALSMGIVIGRLT